MFCRSALALASLLLYFAVASAQPEPAPDFSKLKEESIKKWSGAEVLMSAKLAQAIAGPVGLSNPPLRTYKLVIVPDKIFRGQAKFDKQVTANFSVRQENPPVFPAPEKNILVALKFVGKDWVVQSIEEMSMESHGQAMLATAFPLGWTVKEGKLVSPWASVGKPAKAEGAACSVTGRPVLLAGPGVRFSIEPVPPKVKIKFGNPDGDGEYKLTVTNETDKEVKVPALLTDGKTIHWNESIVLRCQDKNYPVPGSTGNLSGLKPVVLKAGESVSGTIHVFALDGPMWPMGGYRIEFQFCLGEKSATHSFYYLSKHHDPIRAAVQKELKK